MRIGIDCRLWNETGVGRYTRNLVSQLDSLDKKNTYVLFVRAEDIEAIKNQIENIKTGAWSYRVTNIRWHTVEEQLTFPGVLEKENLDLVHFPYFSVPILYSKPFVVTIHDLIIHHFSTGQASTLPYFAYWLKRQGYKHIISQAAKKSNRIIAVSNATKDEIIDHLNVSPRKIAVVYEGVDPLIVKKNEESLSVPKNYFLYVGNAYPRKNLNMLLQAFRKLRAEGGDIELVLLGRDDFFYRRLKEELHDSDGVVFRNRASDSDLAFYYHHARAVVMPSLMEGFGLPPLEAMANDCLVLASDIPSLREVCHNAAVYFDPMNVLDMTGKMKEILSLTKPDASKLRNAGKKRVAEFSWKKMAEQTLRVYEDCLV